MAFYDENKIRDALKTFSNNEPFDYCVIDDFFDKSVALSLEKEFLPFDDPKWFCYKNAVEDKKALNDWNVFPSLSYKVFQELISEKFVSILADAIGEPLYQDPGLHGGGWHIHGKGGNLNPHLDYSIHPKLRLQRKINIIIYMSSELLAEHGGHLGLWAHDSINKRPGDLIKTIQPKFNRAVIFDTTQNSWHGICQPLSLPAEIYRKSLAIYYLTTPPVDVDLRERALFALRPDQMDCESIVELIQKRSDSSRCQSVYRED